MVLDLIGLIVAVIPGAGAEQTICVQVPTQHPSVTNFVTQWSPRSLIADVFAAAKK